MDSDSESKLISLLTELLSLNNIMASVIDSDLESVSDSDSDSNFISLMNQVISLVQSMDLNLQPKPESKLMSLTTQIISLINSVDLDSKPKLLSDLTLFTSYKLILLDSRDSNSELETDSDSEQDQGSEGSSLVVKTWILLISLIQHIFFWSSL